jgi:hypothetical protein
MTATPMTINFTSVPDFRQHSSGNLQDQLPARQPPRTADGKLLTPKQIRARARRKMARHDVMTAQEMNYLYEKPVDEWDLDELAMGRPRNRKGHFSGPKPKWINAAVHEEAMQRYTAAVKSEMRGTTVDALSVLKHLINNDEVDDKGKPQVPAGTKLEAAKFLLEHVVGKPTQRIEQDVSVKLQGILGQVMVNPAEIMGSQQSFMPAHFPGVTMALGEAADNYDDDEFLPEG